MSNLHSNRLLDRAIPVMQLFTTFLYGLILSVLSKACKVIPVMLMGTCIQRRFYTRSEYATAILITVGLNLFLLSDAPEKDHHVTSSGEHMYRLSGAFLILCYMLLDSFTSNWQDRMFQMYSLSPLQVMAGVNFWSVLLTLIPLVQQDSLLSSLRFGFEHHEFLLDVCLSATCSAIGQLFIFLTIANFGPAAFTLIMTLRMGLSILLSCLLFHHALSPAGILGVILVFFALFLRLYLRSTKNTTVLSPSPQLPVRK
ncbi:solute carrier family 35 (adenosine 3'-phospho 5'-phosphosulfate transporter), member B2 [Paragonimus westermani]|uniref:Adenosine 3'-phospho 5'-phosphosulfate transporter 1 n=1 Tax=Paragonimus westermani TaxID=34504 RepID=A0A5J4NPG2_9TREM|nr:solute carrier family 35 (adenosine 3'-phospho 5'-phosphosulfate transporter), member B2 [Paragonimus westermani]